MKTVKRKAKSAALVWKELIPRLASGWAAIRGISAARRGTAVPRSWTRLRPSRKRITTPDGIGRKRGRREIEPPLIGC